MVNLNRWKRSIQIFHAIKLWLLSLKTHSFFPSEEKTARFQASLSSPPRRGTMPAQPSNGFFTQQPSQRRTLKAKSSMSLFPSPQIHPNSAIEVLIIAMSIKY